MAPLKIVIAGPKGSGKSTIANFLSGTVDSLMPPEHYDPTYAVRILECKDNIQLWDASGDQT